MVEIHPNRESTVGNYKPDSGIKDFCSLNAYTFPISAAAFAHEHNLEVFYIDNCWVRVGVSGEQLVKFLLHGFETERDWWDIALKVDFEGHYVIVDEEF